MGVTSRRASSHEPVRKGAHTSYKARDKKTKQAELFPELLEEIEKKRREIFEGKSFTAEERFGEEYRKELAKLAMERIGGTPEEQRQFFDRVVAAYPDVYWIDGCPPPTVRNKLIHFQLSKG